MLTSQTVTRKISFLDLKEQHSKIKKEIFEAFEEVYDNTSFSDGVFVQSFEEEFAAFCNTRYAIGVNNGTSALHLALLALGIGAGDEVIVPANTFIATAWAVSYTGATPVFADCRADTWEICADSVRKRISKKTKAVIGVHLYGQPFDVDEIQKICSEHQLYLLEDAAQAHGARYKGKRVGGFGEMACFSFYPGKNLGACGEAGGITTNQEGYNKRIRSLRNHGSSIRYYHDEMGFNMRMAGMEAVSLSIKLKYLDNWNERRKYISARYRNEIYHEGIRFQMQPDNVDPVHHLFVITTGQRDALYGHLNNCNIFPGLHYPVPCHLQKAYMHLGYRIGDCPNAEYLSAHCLSLPMYAELKEKEIDFIIEMINRY